MRRRSRDGESDTVADRVALADPRADDRRQSRGRREARKNPQCATFWPPFVTTAKAVAADGVTTGKFSTTARKDGSLQVTFNSHPLYFYARDAAAGETNGQGSTGFGAVWQVVSAP